MSLECVGNMKDAIERYAGVKLGDSDSITIEGGLVYSNMHIDKDGNMLVDIQGGVICETCNRRTAEYITHDGKNYCFADFNNR